MDDEDKGRSRPADAGTATIPNGVGGDARPVPFFCHKFLQLFGSGRAPKS
jgi:hypothetical protein